MNIDLILVQFEMINKLFSERGAISLTCPRPIFDIARVKHLTSRRCSNQRYRKFFTCRINASRNTGRSISNNNDVVVFSHARQQTLTLLDIECFSQAGLIKTNYQLLVVAFANNDNRHTHLP